MATQATTTIADNTPVRVSTTSDPATGLDMYREINYFIGNVKGNEIEVSYIQYHVSPTGARMNETYMKYLVRNKETSPAILAYSNWLNKVIDNTLVGARLGQDIILGAIKNELANLPFDVADEFLVN